LEPAPSGQNQSYNNKRFQWLTKSTWKSLRNHIQTIAFKVVPREGDCHAPVTLPRTTNRCKGFFPKGRTTVQASGRRIIAPFVVSFSTEAGNAQPRLVNRTGLRLKNCADGLKLQMQDNKTSLLLRNATDIKPGRLSKLTSAKKKKAARLSDKPILVAQKLNKDSGASLQKLLGPETSAGWELQPILTSRLQYISPEDERL
jgi:hypothetical protein